jgi:hypothetical protein
MKMNNTVERLPNGDFQVHKDIVKDLEEWLTRVNKKEETPTDPNIKLLDECIEGARKRIQLYETLNQGLWYNIFRPDSTNEIIKERELIREFLQMKQEIREWTEQKKK